MGRWNLATRCKRIKVVTDTGWWNFIGHSDTSIRQALLENSRGGRHRSRVSTSSCQTCILTIWLHPVCDMASEKILKWAFCLQQTIKTLWDPLLSLSFSALETPPARPDVSEHNLLGASAQFNATQHSGPETNPVLTEVAMLSSENLIHFLWP